MNNNNEENYKEGFVESNQEVQQENLEPLKAPDVRQENLEAELRDYKNKYLHLLADQENTTKRLIKDRDEIIQQSIRSILLDFLHPIDHMENALKYTEEASDDVKHWAVGFKMIADQFKEVLANNGVKPFDSLGKAFDPHLHHAVEAVETTEYPPGTVVEQSIRGYSIGERILRPARVIVSKAPASLEQDEN